MYQLALLFWITVVACGEPKGDGELPLPFPLAPLKPFAPVYDSVKTAECKKDSLRYLDELKKMKVWALKMYDSSGKIPSGVLRGNTQWLGDVKECFSVSSNSLEATVDGGEDIRGQYCLATIYADPVPQEMANRNTSGQDLREIFDMIHTHNAVRSSYEEPKQFFPSFNTIHLGLCIPHSCTPSDFKAALLEWLSPDISSQETGVEVKAVVHDGSCLKGPPEMQTKGKLLLLFLLSMTLVGAAGYFYETKIEANVMNGEQPTEDGIIKRILLAFSFRKNLRILFDTTTAMDELGFLHGTRAIFCLLLYVIHKFIAILFSPIANREDLTVLFEGNASMLMRAFWGQVDTFVLLSGLLTSYYTIKRLQEGKTINIIKMYFQRYFKFTPIFLICSLWLENIVAHMTIESQYLHYVKNFSDKCRGRLFNILTYTNTFDGMDKMCYITSHQLETDMQMYLLSPFIILLLWKAPKIATLIIFGMMASLSYLKYYVVQTEELTTVVHYGAHISMLEKSADRLYLNFIHRLIPYITGILMGYFLRVQNKKRKLPKVFQFLGSALALWATHYSFLSMMHMSRSTCVYNATEAAIYGTFQPILWSLALSWFIYICASGQLECVNRCLRWKGFLVTSRLSYPFYLCQMGIMLMEVATSPTPITFTPFSLFDLNTMAKVLLTTVWLTLLFFIPTGELWNMLTTKTDTGTSKKED